MVSAAFSALLVVSFTVSQLPTIAAAQIYDGIQDGSGSTSSGSETFDSNLPAIAKPDTFEWVDPESGFIVNGKVVWATVRHDLWGHAGIEASRMADALDLYFPAPNYRKTTPAGVKPDAMLLATTMPGSCKVLLFCHGTAVPEQDKVWYYSRVLKRAVVVTWNDTFVSGERLGDGYYKRDGKRFVRFDEIAPAFGGAVHVDERGLVWVEMPPRSAIVAGEACFLQRQDKNCDIASFLLPEGFSTWGEDNAFWLFGWQADTGGKDGVFKRIMSAKNIYGLKHGGKQPNALAVIGDALDAAALVIPTLYLADEVAGALLSRYVPANVVFETEEDREYSIAVELAAKVPAQQVAKEAEEIVGMPVLPEGTKAAPGRGYYFIIRSMNRPPAEFQRDALDAFVIPMPGYPGKWVMREYGLYEGGPLVDEYICNYVCDTKGNYDWIVLDNGEGAEVRFSIDPYWVRRDLVTKLVKELQTHVDAANKFADNGVKWFFESPKFRAAFEDYLRTYQPGLARQLGTFIHFVDWHS